jgi:hypothetical protein
MSNKFKVALAAASLAGAIIAAGPEVDVNGFEVDIVQNQAVAETVSGAITKAKPVEPYILLARGGVSEHARGAGGPNGRNGGDGSVY